MRTTILGKEFIGFALFMLLGVGAIALAFDYGIGSPRNIGSGFFPFVLGCLLVVLAVVNLAVAFLARKEEGNDVAARMEWSHLKPMVIPVSLVIFGLLIRPLGVILAIIISILVASVADDQPRPVEAFVVGLVMAVGCVLIFIVGLRLPIPVLPQWF